MKAIILAAGKGERLMPLTRNTPKSLIALGNGMTVLETQLENLSTAGVTEVVLVVGYKAEQIEAKIKDYAGFDIRCVYNPFFDVSNNLVSCWMARHEMEDDFMIINGDDVFTPAVIEGLAGTGGEIVMVIDRKREYDSDDMKVFTEGDRITKVSKKLTPEQTNGESIGVMAFRGKGRELMAARLDAMVREKANLGIFYLAALQAIMDDGFPVRFSECSPDDWGEIDFHPDLTLVRENLERLVDLSKIIGE